MGYDPLNPETDPFRPPAIPTLVGCLHCGQAYESYRIEWRIERTVEGRSQGFWCCPIEGCDGRGFCCDIFPLDPNYTDEDGNRVWCDTDDEGESESVSEDDGVDDKPHDNGEEELPW